MEAIPSTGRIRIEQPEQYEILYNKAIDWQINYIEPADSAFNFINLDVKDFYTDELVKNYLLQLTEPDETKIESRQLNINLILPHLGYFKASAQLLNCNNLDCSGEGVISNPQYFSVLAEPSQQQYILNQFSTDGESTKSRGKIIGQVFRPENSGVIDKISMKANLTGSGIQHYHLKIYEWFGTSEDNPSALNYQNKFLAEADTKTINCLFGCDGLPQRDIIYDFTGGNEKLLRNDQYYF